MGGGASGTSVNGLSAPFKKKLKAATWGPAEPIVKDEKTFPPTGGMRAKAQRGMLAPAGHVAWAETCHQGNKSIRDPALRWDRADLQVVREDNELDVDVDVARQLLRPAPRGAPLEPPGRGDQRHAKVLPHLRPPPGAAPG